MSYAVYSIPNIQEAVVRAAKRGVKITVVVETPDKLDVQNEYSTLQALGDDVARCSTVYLLAEGESQSRWVGQARHPARQVRRGRRALAVSVLGEPDEVRLQPEHGVRGSRDRRQTAERGGKALRVADRKPGTVTVVISIETPEANSNP